MKEKLVIICSGGDWADASFEDVMIPQDMSLEDEQKEWRSWYEKEYLPKLAAGEKPTFKSLVDFIVEKGARRAETETFWES